MIPRLTLLLLLLLWDAPRGAEAANAGQSGSSAASRPTPANGHGSSDDMDSYLHAIDSKQSVSILVPNESVRSARKFQLADADVKAAEADAKVTTEAYQTHIPFGTRLRPLTSPRPYNGNFNTEAPPARPGGRRSSGRSREERVHQQPTAAPLRYVVPAPAPRSLDEPRTTPLAERRLDVDEPIFVDSPKKLKKGRIRSKHQGSIAPHKETRPAKRRPSFSSPPPPQPTQAPVRTASRFKDAP